MGNVSFIITSTLGLFMFPYHFWPLCRIPLITDSSFTYSSFLVITKWF